MALKDRYPNTVVNSIVTAANGESSDLGAVRFAADVLAESPDLIILDYALTDVGISLAAMDTAWRSMIDAAQTAEVPVILLNPFGTPSDELTDASTALRQRADLIQTIAASEGVPLADVSRLWLESAAAGIGALLLSPAGLPDRNGHELITDSLIAALTSQTGVSTKLPVSAFPKNIGESSFTTTDGRVRFTTTNSFSGETGFLGDSGGTSNLVNAWDGAETLTIELDPQTRLEGYQLLYTNSTIAISGFLADPQAQVESIGGDSPLAAWNGTTSTLTIATPWNGATERSITFENPDSSLGATLIISLPARRSPMARSPPLP